MTLGEALRIAVGLHQRGEVDAAVELYEQILHAAPDTVGALQYLGVAEHQRRHTPRALDLLARAVALAPDNPDLRNNRGNVFKELGRLDDAATEYGAALALRPRDAGILNNLGATRRAEGRLDEAVDVFRAALALQPDHYEAHQNLGNTLASMERYEEGLSELREALRLRPGNGNSYRYLGAMFYAIGRVSEAAETYGQWLAIAPDDPVARHMVAACRGDNVPARASDDFVRVTFDRFAETFDGSLTRLQYRAPALVAEALDSLGFTPGSLDVLDAGCGTGLCGPLLRGCARHLTGVDLSQRMLDRAHDRGVYDTLATAELTAFLGDHPAAYDLVASADTLVYFGALEAVAKVAAEALRPGAYLVFTVERSSESDAPDGYRIHPHGRYSHSEGYVRRALSEAGMRDVMIREVDLRREAGAWVGGLLVCARRR